MNRCWIYKSTKANIIKQCKRNIHGDHSSATWLASLFSLAWAEGSFAMWFSAKRDACAKERQSRPSDTRVFRVSRVLHVSPRVLPRVLQNRLPGSSQSKTEPLDNFCSPFFLTEEYMYTVTTSGFCKNLLCEYFETIKQILEQAVMVPVKAMSCCFVCQIPVPSMLIGDPKYFDPDTVPTRSWHFQCYPENKNKIPL